MTAFAAREIPAVLLAAGGSTRMGRTKQLLPYRGRTLVWHAASELISAEVSPVILVTGHDSAAVAAAVSDLPLSICHHAAWQDGIGSTLRAGVRHAIERAPGRPRGADRSGRPARRNGRSPAGPARRRWHRPHRRQWLHRLARRARRVSKSILRRTARDPQYGRRQERNSCLRGCHHRDPAPPSRRYRLSRRLYRPARPRRAPPGTLFTERHSRRPATGPGVSTCHP